MAGITIPPAALEAGARAVIQYRNSAMSEAGIARAAFVAMVEAWPIWLDLDEDPGSALILPLPTQKNEND